MRQTAICDLQCRFYKLDWVARQALLAALSWERPRLYELLLDHLAADEALLGRAGPAEPPAVIALPCGSPWVDWGVGCRDVWP